MPGLRFRPWLLYAVKKFPSVQIPADGIGVVIAQVGVQLPAGAKSAVYRPDSATSRTSACSRATAASRACSGRCFRPEPSCRCTRSVYSSSRARKPSGPPSLPTCSRTSASSRRSRATHCPPATSRVASAGSPTSRSSSRRARPTKRSWRCCSAARTTCTTTIRTSRGSSITAARSACSTVRCCTGRFLLNPFLVKVERAPMLVVNQGEVAVIKSYLGLSTQDTSGQEFKFGSIVRPGHRGIWSEPLRTGKYPLTPRVYRAEVVPTAILTLNWAEATSHAHNLDAQLSSIDAKSPEGFLFLIDLQVQIHVPDTMAPKVISMVETMLNLVNEVLQSAVGNYFRNTLQGLPAVQFIETRQDVQDRAERYITECLGKYSVETRACISKTWCYPRRWCRSFRPVSSRCSSGRRSRGSRRRSSLASMSRRPRAPRTRNRYLPAHRSTSTCRRTTRRLAPQRRRVRPTSRG